MNAANQPGIFITKEITTGAIQPIEASGTNFFVVFSPVTLQIKMPGQAFGLYEQGGGIQNLPNGETFNRLEVRNTSLGTILVTIYVGGPLYVDSRHSIIEPDTIAIGRNVNTIAAATDLTFDGIPAGNLIRRKCIQVSNLDANLLLVIKDDSGNVVLSVFPRTSITLPISKSCKIGNANGSIVACNISEIWWTL